MGAPKQKWTSEEEAALKAGIRKYGVGKWSTILKDSEFSTVLRSRSNVDLKDKWRNLNCMANGLGSRHRPRVLVKINPPTAKHDKEATVRTEVDRKDPVAYDATLVAVSKEVRQDPDSKKPITRLEDVVLEAIRKLNEPRGSSRPAIAQYIEDHHSAPSDFEKALAANLKVLTDNGLIVKVKNQYRIAPRPTSFAAEKEPMLLKDGRSEGSSETERNICMLLTKAQIDAELEKMMSMSPEEAAAAAAQYVAEAEAAIAEAEAAAREAEEAEAEAEAARCFADAAQKSLNYPTIRV